MDPTRLGHFDLLEKIGEGGMGQVYKARDTRLERLIAIKLLPESRIADADRRADGQTFIVMELVEGAD